MLSLFHLTEITLITDFLELRKRIIEKEFASLNPEQKKAVLKTEGAVLILAGAGSGKTTVLVNRIANLIKYGSAYHSDFVPGYIGAEHIAFLNDYLEGKNRDHEKASSLLSVDAARPWEVIAITFTNKAANEMKTRLELNLGSSANEIWASTFHSACTKILRRFGDRIGYSRSFTIYDTSDSEKAMKQVQRQLSIDDKMLSHKLILNEISKAKDSLISPEEYRKNAEHDFRLRKIADAYAAYQNLLLKSDAMDFDDIIFNTVKLFREQPDVLEHYQHQFKYVLVDEYQDTNHAQYVLTSLLAGGYGNICVVGDDDQSIYRFRGATVRNILEFEDEWENALVIRLEQNYRSKENILNAANSVIKHNTKRKGKNLWSERGEGEKICVYTAYSENDEAAFIADKIFDDVAAGMKYSDHAVLYRASALSAPVERALGRSGIAYKVLSGHRFYDRKEVKDAMAYLNLVANHDDDIRLMRIINVPKRGIGDTTVRHAYEIAQGLGMSIFEVIREAENYETLYRAAGKLKSFCAMFERIDEYRESASLTDLFDIVMRETGYRDSLFMDENSEERIQNLDQLKSEIAEYVNEAEEPTLEGFLQEVALSSDQDELTNEDDYVPLMTMHASKGLEFPVVFIIGMEEGIFPSRQCMFDPTEVEEERRLAYVGITRAKDTLYLTRSESRMVYGSTNRNRPSRFLDEIPSQYIEQAGVSKKEFTSVGSFGSFAAQKKKPSPLAGFKKENVDVDFHAGDRVKHKTFGTGMVISAEPMGSDVLLEIAFDKVGTKKLMAKFARLTRDK